MWLEIQSLNKMKSAIFRYKKAPAGTWLEIQSFEKLVQKMFFSKVSETLGMCSETPTMARVVRVRGKKSGSGTGI